MFGGMFFLTWRFFEIVTLIPIVGMLAWFVDVYNDNNHISPAFVLVLFIASVIALFWALATVLFYRSWREGHASFVGGVDLCIFGALIAGVYYLRAIRLEDCAHWGPGSTRGFWFTFEGVSGGGVVFTPFRVSLNKACAMLKASFALGIMNVIFFFMSATVCLIMIHSHYRESYRHERVVVRRRHSRSPRHYSRSPVRSHHSRRSSHRYVV